jgi:RNA polymerase sigma-70 factor (ECF subfamily)
MLGDRHDAEEALQDAFVRAFRSLAQCEQPDRFAAWLFRILINRCRTARTRRRRATALFVYKPAPDLADREEPVEAMAWREEIGRALEALPSNQREAFLLRHVEGLSYEEMATLSGVRESALRMRVKRARDLMRELLRDVYAGGP